MSFAKDSSALVTEITKAFEEIKLDGGIGLSEADAIDNYADEDTRNRCRSADEKNSWQVISSDALNQYNTSLSFFDAKGMRFHLPAFMIADLKGKYKFGMAFALTHLSDYRRSQFELLTIPQRKVIRLFLEHLLISQEYEFDWPAIKQALEDYWL